MLNLVGLAFQGIILSWVLKIEKACGCSDRWQRDYIKWHSVAAIGLMIAVAAGMQIKNKALAGAILGASLVNMYAILTFIPKLNKTGCRCATEDDWRDNFIYWWTVLGTLVILFLATSALLKM